MKLFNHEKRMVQLEAVSSLKFKMPAIPVFRNNELAKAALREIGNMGLLQVLLQLGFEEKQHKDLKLNDLRAALNINAKYSRLFTALITLLADDNFLKKEQGVFVVPGSVRSALMRFQLEAGIDELLMDNDEYAPFARLLKVCLLSLKDILTGKVQATEVIFPNGEMAYVSGI